MLNYNTIYQQVKRYRATLLFIGTIALSLNSCKKMVDIDAPTSSISGKNVYSINSTAIAVMTGIYSKMSAAAFPINDLTGIGYITALSSDELTLYNGVQDYSDLFAYYQNNLTASSQVANNVWNLSYPKIYIINSVIEGVTASNSLTTAVKQQLMGEAKFMRAFCYFYLVNLYGDVPLILTTDYKINLELPRAPKNQVWKQIITDLKEAQQLLSNDYLNVTLLSKSTARVRPNKWAATALLARCYLYIQDWKNSEEQAEAVIKNSSLYQLDEINNVFLTTSVEAIWQLQPVNAGWNTEDAKSYIITSFGPSTYTGAYLSTQLLASFEKDDLRKKNWVDSINYLGLVYYFPFKYKSATYGADVTEYQTVLRLGEQYLIRAEARLQQNNISGAQEDLNTIRHRAGLPNTQASTLTTLLSAINHERQIELFTEWGHRWLDIKRTQKVNEIMNIVTPTKGGTWNSNWQFYPIPFFDIRSNSNINQNEGY